MTPIFEEPHVQLHDLSPIPLPGLRDEDAASPTAGIQDDAGRGSRIDLAVDADDVISHLETREDCLQGHEIIVSTSSRPVSPRFRALGLTWASLFRGASLSPG